MSAVFPMASTAVSVTQSCPVCGNNQGNRLHGAREMMFGTRDKFAYMECSQCGTLSLSPPPADLAKYYPSDYYSFQPIKGFYRFAKQHLARYSLTGKDPLGFIAALFLGHEGSFAALRPIPLSRQARILDVGSGSGAFLRSLAELGFTQLLGIDPFLPEARLEGQGYTIQRTTLGELTGTFDVITLNHVFEHLPDPAGTLAGIAERLASQGVAIIRIPVADSYAWEHFGVNWVQLDCPRHLFLHTRKGMDLLARKAGLQVNRVLYDSTSFQFWGSRLYERDIPLTSGRSILKSRWRLLLHLPQLLADSRRAKRLNQLQQGDAACFYLVHARPA